MIPFREIMIDPSKFEGDIYKPQYHISPPGHWMNEPHAPFYYNGKYHLTYQYNPTGPYWHQLHWGHWVSEDMIHWKHLPAALRPENDTIAPDGIWSGSTTYDRDGSPVMFYTFGNWSKVRNQGVALARPKALNDPDLVEWVKDPAPAIVQTNAQGLVGEFRDPFAWRDTIDNKWYVIIGSGIEEKGGTAWLYESDDLEEWNFKGPFYLVDFEKYPYLGPIWELPVFMPIGKYPNGETKYMFIILPKSGFGQRCDTEVYYWFGRFNKQQYRFEPDFETPRLIDLGDFDWVGPSSFVDPKTGRVIMYVIAEDHRSLKDRMDSGWANNVGLPVQLSLDDTGELVVEPIEETESLRAEVLIEFKDKTMTEANELLSSINGNMLEIEVELENQGSKEYGIKLLKSPDGREETLFYYDNNRNSLLCDNTKSAIHSDPSIKIKGGKLDLKGENLKMRIFIDHSQIETYANKRKILTRRAYPKLKESKGISIWADEDVKVKSMKVWKLNSIQSGDL